MTKSKSHSLYRGPNSIEKQNTVGSHPLVNISGATYIILGEEEERLVSAFLFLARFNSHLPSSTLMRLKADIFVNTGKNRKRKISRPRGITD